MFFMTGQTGELYLSKNLQVDLDSSLRVTAEALFSSSKRMEFSFSRKGSRHPGPEPVILSVSPGIRSNTPKNTPSSAPAAFENALKGEMTF